MNKIIISLVALFASFGLVANAQQIQGDQSTKINSVETTSIQERAQINDSRTGLQDGVEPKQLKKVGDQNGGKLAYPRLATTSEAVKAAVEKMQQEREDFKVKVEALKQEAQTVRTQAKEVLKAKLQAIKDENKKAAVQRLDENINKLNSNFVEKWTKNLYDMDTYLAKLVGGANTASTTGKDLTSFNDAIGSAKSAIVAARTALEIQAKKSYDLTISTEANLKSDVSSVRGSLNNDLKSVKDLVQAAHSAVVVALTEFNKVK